MVSMLYSAFILAEFVQAAKRRAITELLFFASVGDLKRCQRIVRLWHLDVKDQSCCDYDRRTPLYVVLDSPKHRLMKMYIHEDILCIAGI